MKTFDKIDYGNRNEHQFRNNYSFFENDLRIKQLENHDFIVPWQLIEPKKKEVLVE
jgi:hypothetical protein